MKKTLTMGIVLVLLLACIGVTSAFANGGFEAPVVTNGAGWDSFPDGTSGLIWTVEQGLGADPSIPPTLEIQQQAAIGLVPYEGEQFAELDSNANANISQMISTKPGKTYKISFAQACRSDGGENPSLLGVYWGDTYLGQKSCTETMTWVTHTYSPTASSIGQVKLMFVDEGTSNSYGVLLDAVVVEEEEDNNVPVPEFPTMALPAALIVGILGSVLFIKRTKEE
jgi:hypothetical protein